MILCPFFNLKFFDMATFKLGALITEIKGSISGTTLKTFRGSNVMYNKQKRQNLSKNNINSKSFKNGYFFQLWNSLSSSEKNDWIIEASKYQFPDKFGDLKYLTGRQFFIKMCCQYNQGLSVPNVREVYNTPTLFVLDGVAIDWGSNTFSIYSLSDMGAFWVVFKAKQVTPGTDAVGSAKGLTFYQTFRESSFSWDVYSAFVSKFPNANIGDRFILEFCGMNEGGYQSGTSRTIITIV